MIKLKIAAAVLAAFAAVPAIAAPNWNGSANYGVEAVGPFNTYDFSAAGALLIQPTGGVNANGYYQSFVTEHLKDNGLKTSNPLLSSGNYEITVVADFTSQLTSNTPLGQTFEVTGGNFSLWLDTTPDLNWRADSGFSNGIKIMEGSVISGAGSTVKFFGQQFGGGALQLSVANYDHTIYEPDNISSGISGFTLRLSPVDAAFTSQITSVQGNAVASNVLYTADGDLSLTAAVPEPESYAMLLAGLGLIGAIARRRSAR